MVDAQCQICGRRFKTLNNNVLLRHMIDRHADVFLAEIAARLSVVAGRLGRRLAEVIIGRN